MAIRTKPVLDILGSDMRSRYDSFLSEPPPEHLARLLRRFAAETLRLPRIEDGPTV
jgi:hypothetical protein